MGPDALAGRDQIELPAAYFKGAVIFLADEVEQEFRFIGLPRMPDNALAIVDERHFKFDQFWGEGASKIDLRPARGLRQMTTPEAG